MRRGFLPNRLHGLGECRVYIGVWGSKRNFERFKHNFVQFYACFSALGNSVRIRLKQITIVLYFWPFLLYGLSFSWLKCGGEFSRGGEGLWGYVPHFLTVGAIGPT